MIDKQRLKEKAQKHLDINTDCIDALDYYAKLLVSYNEKVNLTAIVKPEDIEDKHFIDCLYIANQPFVTGAVCDVGSGAGFPGVVMSILKPDIRLTLLEPTAKRCKFLEHLCHELGISANIVNARAEDIGRKEMREKFDLVTARAVAGLPVLLEYCLPLCKVGGKFVAMKGDAEDLTTATNAAKRLGADEGSELIYTLPAGEFRRLLIFNKKTKTDKKFPRHGGTITKKPLL